MGIREVEVASGLIKLQIQELEQICDPVTGRTLTGSWLWDSAIVLSNWMASEDEVQLNLQGKTVLELGTGMGIPGLTATRLGATRVILTDVALLLPGLCRNVELNGLENRVEVRELVWGSDESWVSRLGESGEVDSVLLSDVFFDSSEMAALAKTLKMVCGPRTRVWAASEMREWTGECIAELASEGFEVIELASQLGPDSLVMGGVDNSPPLFSVFRLVPCDGDSV